MNYGIWKRDLWKGIGLDEAAGVESCDGILMAIGGGNHTEGRGWVCSPRLFPCLPVVIPPCWFRCCCSPSDTAQSWTVNCNLSARWTCLHPVWFLTGWWLMATTRLLLEWMWDYFYPLRLIELWENGVNSNFLCECALTSARHVNWHKWNTVRRFLSLFWPKFRCVFSWQDSVSFQYIRVSLQNITSS